MSCSTFDPPINPQDSKQGKLIPYSSSEPHDQAVKADLGSLTVRGNELKLLGEATNNPLEQGSQGSWPTPQSLENVLPIIPETLAVVQRTPTNLPTKVITATHLHAKTPTQSLVPKQPTASELARRSTKRLPFLDSQKALSIRQEAVQGQQMHSIELGKEEKTAAKVFDLIHQASTPKSIQNTPTSKQVQQATQEPTCINVIAQGGHRVSLGQKDGLWTAHVHECLPVGFSRELDLPVVYGEPLLLTIETLARHDSSWHKRHIHVCLPERDPKGIGYLYIGPRGLQGGAQGIRLSVDDLLSSIVSGYSSFGITPATAVVNSWRPLLHELASALGSMDLLLDVRGPMSLDQLDVGNTRVRFEGIVQRATQRHVRLENYGVACNHIANQVREKIIHRQSIAIDPASYPRDSYTITLEPKLFSLLSLFTEVNRIYAVGVGSSLNVDLSRILNVLDVAVSFNASFFEFESREKEQRANLQNKVMRQYLETLEKVQEELSSIENNFTKIKGQLQGRDSGSSSEDLQGVLNTLKLQHGALMLKFTILDNLAGAHEEARAKRKV